jgi:hypothetical protein
MAFQRFTNRTKGLGDCAAEGIDARLATSKDRKAVPRSLAEGNPAAPSVVCGALRMVCLIRNAS